MKNTNEISKYDWIRTRYIIKYVLSIHQSTNFSFEKNINKNCNYEATFIPRQIMDVIKSCASCPMNKVEVFSKSLL